MFYVPWPKIYGHLMLNYRQHAPACWPCYEFHTLPPSHVAYTWHALLASLGVLVFSISFSLLCILFIFFCSFVYADSILQQPALDCSVVHCPFSFALCLRYIAYQIYFTVTIFNLLFVFRFGPDANFHPPSDWNIWITVCKLLYVGCDWIPSSSLPATPIPY